MEHRLCPQVCNRKEIHGNRSLTLPEYSHTYNLSYFRQPKQQNTSKFQIRLLRYSKSKNQLPSYSSSSIFSQIFTVLCQHIIRLIIIYKVSHRHANISNKFLYGSLVIYHWHDICNIDSYLTYNTKRRERQPLVIATKIGSQLYPSMCIANKQLLRLGTYTLRLKMAHG